MHRMVPQHHLFGPMEIYYYKIHPRVTQNGMETKRR
jgi:hypothetical protein